MMISGLPIDSLMPTVEMLSYAAYGAFAGDRACISWGVNKGRNPGRRDTMGLTKETVYDAAVYGDMAFFLNLHQALTANPWQFPPSLRTLIPKDAEDPGKGTRPIDDPCEMKRLVTLCVRHEIEALAERYMHPGQYGGRPAWAIKPTCLRKSATMQDHVATAIWRAIRKGYRHVLILDLKDAYGLLPERAALDVLQGIGLDNEAARWVWRLCQIDAVDSRTRRIHYTRQGRGIEQGNVLSSTVMNLVLAPICRSIERSLDVQVFSYLDDIYVLAPTEEIAMEAFFRFRQSARDRGFTNVRRLRRQDDPSDSKNSQIINVEEQPVTVLKTYEVDGLGISLHPDKVLKLRQVGKVSLSKFRKLSNCRALTKAACRSRNLNAIRPALQKPVTYPSDAATPVDKSERTLPPSSLQEPPVTNTGSLVSENLKSHVRGRKELENPDSDMRAFPRSDCDTSVAVSSYGERIISSRCHGADGIPYDRDSCRPQGVTTPDRMRDGAGDRRAFLSVHSLDILRNIFNPGRLALGNKYKTSILDLTKLAPIIGNDVAAGSIVQGVNRLIRLVRFDDQAAVRIDPKEAWTAIPTILGNAEDAVYIRKSFKFQNDGTVIIALVAQTQKREPGKSDPVPQEADVVVRSIRAVDRANNRHRITLTVHGNARSEIYDASSPNDVASLLEALAHVLTRFPDSVVAVAADVVPLLEDIESIEPANVGIRRVLNAELRDWAWTRAGDSWLLGCRECISQRT